MTTEEKMRQVLSLADQAMPEGELPIAAMVFDGDRVASQAFTTERRDQRLLVHAELRALLELDRLGFRRADRQRIQTVTNLASCMMCLGAALASFIGEFSYSMAAPSDGAAVWAAASWATYHEPSVFALPRIGGGILVDESRAQFERYVERLWPREVRGNH